MTLFKSHISYKWDNIMYLFEDIYNPWYLGRMCWKWHQYWYSDIEIGDTFGEIVKNHLTHILKLLYCICVRSLQQRSCVTCLPQLHASHCTLSSLSCSTAMQKSGRDGNTTTTTQLQWTMNASQVAVLVMLVFQSLHQQLYCGTF